jgi:hypothetical protein
MNKILMTEGEVKDLLEFEDRCGVNNLLQEIASVSKGGKKEIKIFKVIDDSGIMKDYSVELEG